MKTRAEEARKQFNIPVISSPCFQYANLHLTRGVNFNNLVAVSKTKPSHQNRASVIKETRVKKIMLCVVVRFGVLDEKFPSTLTGRNIYIKCDSIMS